MTPTPSSRPSRSLSRPAARCCEPLRTEVVDDEMVADPARPWPGDAQAQNLWGGVRLGGRQAPRWVRLVALGDEPFRCSPRRFGGAEIEYPIVVLDRVAETGVPLSGTYVDCDSPTETQPASSSPMRSRHTLRRSEQAPLSRGSDLATAPDEFQSMTELVRGPGGVVGLQDSRLARLTVFRPGDGDPLAIFALPPGLFRPLGPFGDMIAWDLHSDLGSGPWRSGSPQPEVALRGVGAWCR